jgi:hypothetical protein
MFDDDALHTPRVAPQYAKDGFTGIVNDFTAKRRVASYVEYPYLFIACNCGSDS